MAIRTFSTSRSAFDLTSDAMRLIDQYLQTRRYDDIEEADRNIKAAVKADADYALAVYYRGIVHDLRGTPAKAVHYFERILRESEDADLKLKSRFNLGVAYYHQYSHQWLEKANECFEAVIDNPADESLATLAKAHLAQTHAMWMRPSTEQKQRIRDADVQDRIKRHFEASKHIVGALRKQPGLSRQVEAAAANAAGMANQYITDHVSTTEQAKRKHLRIAQDELQKAERALPNDWATTCDLASLSLRLGVLARDTGKGDADAHFAEAARQHKRVVEELRPEYGFALYELGILHRVWQKWDEARKFQDRAKAVPARYRDVRDERLDHELQRIDDKDDSYP